MPTKTASKMTIDTDSQIAELTGFAEHLWDGATDLHHAEEALRVAERGAQGLLKVLAVTGMPLDDALRAAIVQLGTDENTDAEAIRSQILAAAALQVAAPAVGAVGAAAVEDARGTVHRARLSASDMALGRMNTTLSKVLTLTREVLTQLAGCDTADAAIAAGPTAITAYGRLHRLRDIRLFKNEGVVVV